jgi:hypothetical protein
MYCVHFCLGKSHYLGFVPPPPFYYRPHIICSFMMLLELV